MNTSTNMMDLSQGTIHATQGTGKSASLLQLLQLKLPVPRGFIVGFSWFHEHKTRALHTQTSKQSPGAMYRAILETDLSKDFQEEFRAAWRRHNLRRVAVRSSANIEDGLTSSYAGQFDTYLNQTSATDAMNAVRRCWASLFAPRVTAYDDGLHDHARMSVIVQKMVSPKLAGVAFTQEPTFANGEMFYVEWVEGLGDQLVSGERISGRAWLNRRGEVQRIDYEDEYTSPPSARFWSRLSEYLNVVVRGLGDRQDIEWAWNGREVFCLQSRPITVRPTKTPGAPPPWILPGKPFRGWTDEQRMLFDLWDEYNPLGIRPLEYELLYKAIWQANLEMLGTSDSVPAISDAVILFSGVPVAVDPTAPATHPCSTANSANISDWQTVLQAWEAERADLYARYDQPSELKHRELLEGIKTTASALCAAHAFRLSNMTWIDAERDNLSAPRRLVGENFENERLLDAIASKVDHDTVQMNAALAKLAQAFHAQGPDFDNKLTNFLKKFGHFSFEGVTLEESPEVVVRQFGEPDARVPATSQKRSSPLLNKLRRGLPNPRARTKFDQLVTELSEWNRCRENSKMRQEYCRPLLNRLLREAGDRLADANYIEQPADIYFLTLVEFESAITKRTTSKSRLTQRVEQRKQIAEWKSHRSWLPAGFVEQIDRDSQHVSAVPGSPGIAQGPAKVVNGPHEFGTVKFGDILVARATNPLWTQLFNRVSGVVIENGSRLSHAVIVAREKGLPAVIGAAGIMQAITSGEHLRIDGTAGTIERLPSR